MPHLGCLALERHLKTWTRRHEATESHGDCLKGNTRHSVDESRGIEITEKADRSASQLEICQDLRLVDRQDFLDCLDLEDQRFVHHEIDPKSVWDHSRFVNDGIIDCRRIESPSSTSSQWKHSSYVDSRRPGPNSVWTAIPARITRRVRSSNSGWLRVIIQHLPDGPKLVSPESTTNTQKTSRIERSLNQSP